MKTKKIIVLAIVVNIGIMLAYLAFSPGSIAADGDSAQPAVQTQTAQPAENTTDDEWEALRKRKQELDDREVELKNLEAELNAKITRLEELEASIRQEVEQYRVISDDRIRHLVKIYSSMKPKAAAQLMNNLDINVAVEVFLNMKGDIAGGILSYMDTRKAATITKKLANYKKENHSE